MRRCAGSRRGAQAGGVVGINVGANKDSARSHCRLCRPDRAFRRGGELCHGQYFVAQYARLAQHAASRCARRSAGPRDRRPRARCAACRSDAGAAQDRARSVACRSRRHRRHCPFAPRRRHDRRQHHGGAAAATCARPRKRKRRADCRGGRCLRWPTACWPKPMCGSKACFR